MTKHNDQERALFEETYRAQCERNHCPQLPQLRLVGSGGKERYADATEQALWEGWQSRAQLPAGGAVPEGWRLIEKTTCYVLMDGNRVVASLAGPSADDDAKIIANMLAAPHPVSGEQKAPPLKMPGKRLPNHGGSPDFNNGYNAAIYEVQFLNPSAKCIEGQTPAAQDVSGLVEALEELLAGTGSSPGANKRYGEARAALAAHRAQAQAGDQ